MPLMHPSELGRPHHRLRNPLQTGVLYQFRQPLYDFYGVTVATVATLQKLFTIPQGQSYTPAGGAALAKSAWHTNMNAAGQLPSPQKHYAKGLSLSLRSDVAAIDAIRFLNDTIVSFFIGGRTYLDLHAMRVPQSGGPYGFSSALITNGLPVAQNFFELVGDLGEIVEQLQSFRVELDPTKVIDAAALTTFTTATTANGGFGINAFVYVDGILNREVQ